MVMRLLIACVVLLGACKFNEKDFGDRSCKSELDCRPDEKCSQDLCTQKECRTSADCGITGKFECNAGACVAQACTGDAECGTGYACSARFCRPSFNVVSAVALSNTKISMTFDAPPDDTTATDNSNYSITGLTLTGTPTLAGSTVTLTTSPQTSSSYTVTAAGVTRAMDGAPIINGTAIFTGRSAFNVTGATAVSSVSISVTFSDPPDPTAANNINNYSIAGLGVSGTPSLAGNVVTITTGAQVPNQAYVVTVANIARASDDEALTIDTASFTGRAGFNVAMAQSTSNTTITVTFDAPPKAGAATTLGNYDVPGLTLSGTPTLAGNTVTLTTSTQSPIVYTVTVTGTLTGVTRSSDNEPLTVNTAQFTGRAPFDVASAASLTNTKMSVTFDAAPDPTAATTLANYAVGGLTLSGVPVLAGNVVTINTATQAAQDYTVTVTNVTRATDAEPLATNTATFTGRAQFNLTSALSTSNTTVVLTFSAAPNGGQAAVVGNYTIAGLTVLNAVQTSNTVTLTTSPQTASMYTVMVANVTRSSDGEALTTSMASFMGRSSFNVMSAAAPTSSTITVTFDGPPNIAQAQTASHYNVPGLTLSNPVLIGNTVTLTTTAMAAQVYTVTVSGVTRTDNEPLAFNTANFTGRPKFNVASAASASNVLVKVTFDAPPDPTQATTLGNYSVNNGLMLSGTPTLSGNTVTISTSSQTASTTYTVTVTGVTRATDAEPLNTNTATFAGLAGFNVIAAASVNTTKITVTFDAPPDPTQSQTAGNYVISNGPNALTVSSPVLAGNTVTLTTTNQITGTYTVTVNGVTRASDASPLVVKSATFSYVSFNVTAAAATTNHSGSITFDAPPTAGPATTAANYNVVCTPNPGCNTLTLTNLVLSGNTVTFTTTAQVAGKTYTITANNNVTRASDLSILQVNNAAFVGRASFNVTAAAAPTSGTATVTFDAPPNATQAAVLANYNIPGLTLSGTPQLSGNVVTLNTSVQSATSYTVTVTGVTRASDAEPLTTNAATFTGKAQTAATVTNVQIQSTVPDNGTTFYNTGTATIVITGTEFNGVNCMTGVKLNDTDALGAALGTTPSSCTVNSATQITATFPAGIRTNYVTGWDVIVTNSVGSNTSSAVKVIVKAGLLVSEVYAGSGGSGNGSREYFEVYNPTANTQNVDTVGLVIHIRDSGSGDVVLTPTFTGGSCASSTCTKDIPSHKFWLLASSSSVTNNDSWVSHKDGIYSTTGTQLVRDGGIYLSLSTTAQTKVVDKLGWGSQAAAGREGTAVSNFGDDSKSTQRKPGPPNGAATDTDANSTDFSSPSGTTSPTGTRDPAQP